MGGRRNTVFIWDVNAAHKPYSLCGCGENKKDNVAQHVANLSNEPSKANRIWYPSFCNCSPRLAIHLNPVRVSSNKKPSRSAMVWRILDDTVDAIMAAVAGFCPFCSALDHIHQPSRAPNSLPEKTFQSPLQLSRRSVKRIKKGICCWPSCQLTLVAIQHTLDDPHRDRWPKSQWNCCETLLPVLDSK